jgi:hypothetical protein
MRLRFTLPATVSACQTALHAQVHFEPHPFRKMHFAPGQTGLVTGTVTFGAGRTYQQGSSLIDSAVYAMTL